MDDRKFFHLAMGLILVFVLGILIKETKSVLFPFILAIFISHVIDPVIVFLMRLKVPKAAAVALILVAAFAFLYFLGAIIYASGKTLAAELPRYEQRLTDLAGFLQKGVGGIPLKFRLSTYLEKVNLQGVASFILASLGPFMGLVSKLLLLLLFLAFIIAGRGRATTKLLRAIGPEKSAEVLWAIGNVNLQVRKYLQIKTLMSLINGLEVWLVLTIFGVDFALLFGFLAFLLNFIPNIGSLIAAILRVGFAFFQFGTIWTPLWILIITVGLDTIISNWIEPGAMGRGLSLSPLCVFFSLVFWGWLWGIPGMLMAVPLMAVIKIVCHNVDGLEPVAILLGP